MMNVSVLLEDDRDELADQRPDQPGRLGQADADHHHEDDRHRREVAEVVDERREQEADAVDRQQPLDRGRLGPELVGLGRLLLVRRDVDRLGRAAVVGLLGGDRRRRDDLVGGLDVEPGQRPARAGSPRGRARGTGSPGPASGCRTARSRRAPLHERVLGAARRACVAHRAPSAPRTAEERRPPRRPPSRTRRAARARRARGCSRSRRWSRRAAPRRPAAAPASALTIGIEPPLAGEQHVGAPGPRPRGARRRVRAGRRSWPRSRSRSARGRRSSSMPNGRTARRCSITAIWASTASCSGCTRTLSTARA